MRLNVLALLVVFPCFISFSASHTTKIRIEDQVALEALGNAFAKANVPGNGFHVNIINPGNPANSNSQTPSLSSGFVALVILLGIQQGFVSGVGDYTKTLVLKGLLKTHEFITSEDSSDDEDDEYSTNLNMLTSFAGGALLGYGYQTSNVKMQLGGTAIASGTTVHALNQPNKKRKKTLANWVASGAGFAVPFVVAYAQSKWQKKNSN